MWLRRLGNKRVAFLRQPRLIRDQKRVYQSGKLINEKMLSHVKGSTMPELIEKSTAQLFEDQVTKYAEKEWLCFLNPVEIRLTWEQVKHRVDSFALGLIDVRFV